MQAGTTYNATAKQISSPGFLVISQAGPSLTTSTSSSSPTSKSPSTPAVPSSLSAGAKAGISVGAAVVGILLLVLLALPVTLFVEDRQRRLARGNITDVGEIGSKITDPSLGALEAGASQATPAHYPVPCRARWSGGHQVLIEPAHQGYRMCFHVHALTRSVNCRPRKRC